MKYITIFVILLSSVCIFCNKQKGNKENNVSQSYILPEEITLDFTAERGSEGQIFIVGTTNLPNGIKLGAEITKGKLKCQDFNIIVKDGQFRSTAFTDHNTPFPPSRYNVQVSTYFNTNWQTPDIIKIIGKSGMNLKGKIIKLEDSTLVDSDRIIEITKVVLFPPLSDESNAIILVKHAILVVDGSRSATDIEENIKLFMKNPEIRPAKRWSAKLKSGMTYTVSYSFINGDPGEEQAIWEVNITTKKVSYINKNAKLFSWTPDY